MSTICYVIVRWYVGSKIDGSHTLFILARSDRYLLEAASNVS